MKLICHVRIEVEKLMNEYQQQHVSLAELAFLVLPKVLFCEIFVC